MRVGDPLPGLGVVIGVLSMVLIPLSSEVIRLEFASSCDNGGGGNGGGGLGGGLRDENGDGDGDGNVWVATGGVNRVRVCALGLRKSGVPMRVAEGVLGVMAVLVVVMGGLLLRWRTGVAAEPWSVASMAGFMARGGGLRDVVRGMDGVGGIRSLRDKRFRLVSDGEDGIYGVVVSDGVDDDAAAEKREGKQWIRLTVPKLRERKPVPPGENRRWWPLVVTREEHIVHILALIFIGGLLALILYYENTSFDTPFEAFMDSESFGVRILFTTFGIAVSGFWDYYFAREQNTPIHHNKPLNSPTELTSKIGISSPSIHRRLATRPEPAHQSILLAPPAHIFSVSPKWLASLLRDPTAHDLLSLSIAIATLLAKFTPIMFSNIPFRNTATWKMHESCTWMAIGVLSYMVLVLVAALVVRSPAVSMPVKPETIAGCMYYLCDSTMVADFEGTATMGRKERDKLVGEMGWRYALRGLESAGQGGKVERNGRVGVDYERR